MTDHQIEILSDKCSGCGTDCDAHELKCASIPSVYSLMAFTDAEPDDTGPPLAWIDRQVYCRRCRRRVNLRRTLFAIFVVFFLLFVAGLVPRLL